MLLINDNTAIRALTTINKCAIGVIMSKYRIPSFTVGVNAILCRIWMQFVEDSVTHGKIVFC